MTKHSNRAAIYARISHDPAKTNDEDDQSPRKGGDGLGVQRQEQDCRELAAHRGLTVTQVYVDNDTSAYSGRRRPQFDDMLDAMKNNQFDVLLCWHTDRLYRSMKDLERLIEVAEAQHVAIRAVQGGELDLSTSAGRMVARILGSVARQESEHMSERRISANEQKAQAGKWQTANRAFGYTWQGEPLEPEASAVRKAALDVLAGKSIQGVAREWNTVGLLTTMAGKTHTNPHTKKEFTIGGLWSAPSVRRLLVNPRYAGIKTHRGKTFKGDWTPLIDARTHKGLVALLSDPKRVKCTSFERKYIGSGLYVCGICGDGTTMKAAMPGSPTARPNNRKSRAYVCRKRSHLLRAGEPLDAYVTAWVLEVLSRPKARLRLDNQDIDLDSVGVQREALVQRKDAVRRAHNAGSLEEAEYLADLADLASQIAQCDTALAAATRTSPAAALVAAGKQIWQRWQAMTPTEQAQAIDEIAVVTVLPATRKGAGFNPSDVRITPKRAV
jgi:DNA invertase Pin-like site-specific DNA recombinase